MVGNTVVGVVYLQCDVQCSQFFLHSVYIITDIMRLESCVWRVDAKKVEQK